jgi:hypothetical protein
VPKTTFVERLVLDTLELVKLPKFTVSDWPDGFWSQNFDDAAAQ